MSVSHSATCFAERVRPSLFVPNGYVWCGGCRRLVSKSKNELPVRPISAALDDQEDERHEEPSPEPSEQGRTEALVCAACDATWDRPVKRGRKPKRCPACS